MSIASCTGSPWVHSLSHHPHAPPTPTGGTRPFSRCGLTDSGSITSAHWLVLTAGISKRNLGFHPGPERERHCCLAAHAAEGKQPRGGKIHHSITSLPLLLLPQPVQKNLLCRNNCLVQVLPAPFSRAAGRTEKDPDPILSMSLPAESRQQGRHHLNAIQIKPRRAKQGFFHVCTVLVENNTTFSTETIKERSEPLKKKLMLALSTQLYQRHKDFKA